MVRVKSKYLETLEEDGEIWDEAGHIIAISRQFAQFRNPNP